MRSLKTPITVAVVTLAALAGALVLYPKGKEPPRPVPTGDIGSMACGVREFDYVTFLNHIAKAKQFDAERIKALEADPKAKVREERLAYLRDKDRALDSLARLTDAQVRATGTSFGCMDEGGQEIMYEAEFPTYATLEKEKIIQHTAKRFDDWKAKSEDAQILPWLLFGVTALGTLGSLGLNVIQFKKQRDDRAEEEAAKRGASKPPRPPAKS